MRRFLAERAWLAPLVLLVLAASLIIAGVARLVGGDLHYSNYWGGSVFAPFAIVVGVCLLPLILVFRRRAEKPSTRLRGKAARRARQAEATRFPIDDFDKPWNR